MLDTFAMAQLLKGDYRRTFEQIALYGDMSEIPEQFTEDRILNIYDLLVEAQENGKPVEKIIGPDLKQFCEEYFSPDEKGFWTKEIFKRIFRVCVIMLVVLLIDYAGYYAKDGTVSLQSASITGSPLLVGTLVAGVMLIVGRIMREKLMFRNSKVKPILYYIVMLLIFVLGIGFGTVWADKIGIEIGMLPVLLLCGGYCVVYLLVTLLGRYQRFGNFKDPEKPSREEKAEKKAFGQEISLRAEMINSAKEMEKRYRKLKRKNEKKGKPEYTMEDFTKLINKETNLKGYKAVFITVPTIASMWVLFSVAADENIRLAVFVAGVFAVIMFFAWRFIWNVCKEVFVAQRMVIEECESRGIDIAEYVLQMEKSE